MKFARIKNVPIMRIFPVVVRNELHYRRFPLHHIPHHVVLKDSYYVARRLRLLSRALKLVCSLWVALQQNNEDFLLVWHPLAVGLIQPIRNEVTGFQMVKM